MPIRNTQDHYGSVVKSFHWLIALLVIAMLIIGVSMGYIDNKALRSEVYAFHKSLGLTILGLMILRLFWRLGNPTPSLPSHLPAWQRFGARFSHVLLYLTIILMPISGICMSTAAGYPPKFFGLFTVAAPISKSKAISSFFADMHEVLAWIIVALLVVHILAALKHHFIHKDHVLRRMLPGKNKQIKTVLD